MIFDIENMDFLCNELHINVNEFETYLSDRFGSETQCFNLFLSFLLKDKTKRKLPTLDMMNQHLESELLNMRAFEHIRESLIINQKK